MDKCCLAYFKSFLYHSANTTFASEMPKPASLKTTGQFLQAAKILGPFAGPCPRKKEHQPQRSNGKVSQSSKNHLQLGG